MGTIGDYLLDAYGENGLEYWSSKNNVSPFDISAFNKNKFWFKCDMTDYHEDYLQYPIHYSRGVRCPYCKRKKIHPRDSFAQYFIDEIGDDFLEKYWDYDKNDIDPWTLAPAAKRKVWIKCQNKNHPSYDIQAHSFKSGCRCPYCKKKKLIYEDTLEFIYPEGLKFWSDKNKESPADVSSQSHKAFYWKCHADKHPDYQRTVYNSVKSNFLCPNCQKEKIMSHLQFKVAKYISNDLKLQINHEYQCSIACRTSLSKRLLPYDNDVTLDDGKHLIIEVHGIQHYEITRFAEYVAEYNDISPEEALKKQQERDEAKKTYALEHGFFYLAIPYTAEKDDAYKAIIDQKIAECLQT